MDDKNSKIVQAFSILPEGKRRLDEFFKARLADLCSEDGTMAAKAEKDLASLLAGDPEGTGVLPAESIRELRDILAGKSEYALKIGNAPERDDIGKIERVDEKNSYGYHLTKAVYKLCGLKHVLTRSLSRDSHKGRSDIVGDRMHRDMLPRHHKAEDRAQYLTLVCPQNSENAVTRIIKLKQALESVPEKERGTIKLNVSYRNEPPDNLTIEETIRGLAMLQPLVESVEIPVDEPQAHMVIKAIERHSERVNLQPGDLLFLDEKNTFHRAYKGPMSKVRQIPEDVIHSRVLHHIAGGRV